MPAHGGNVAAYLNYRVDEFIIAALGGINTVRIIHRIAATVFILQAIYHVFIVGYKLIVLRLEASMLPGIKDGKDVIDPRFQVELADYWGKVETVDATPRSSDGQLLFLMEMVDKMKSTSDSAIGSRIASVHNGSSLFTGDAGSGESNIRRFIIENDMLDTIIQLPNNLFYNTGITTYIWLLTNAKPADRRGRVQLIDANLLYRKLRKNLGDKNCEFAPEHIDAIITAYFNFQPVERQIALGPVKIGV